jgi:hypothetical protein
VCRVYRELARQAAASLTSEDVESYTSARHYDHNRERDVYEYVYTDGGAASDEAFSTYHEDSSESNQQAETEVDGNRNIPVVKQLFSETAGTTPARPNSPEKTRQQQHAARATDTTEGADTAIGDAVMHDLLTANSNISGNTWYSGLEHSRPGPCTSRRCLFAETELEARIRVSDQSDSDDLSRQGQGVPARPLFAVRVYDVGEACDVLHLSPVRAQERGREATSPALPATPLPPASPVAALSKHLTGLAPHKDECDRYTPCSHFAPHPSLDASLTISLSLSLLLS